MKRLDPTKIPTDSCDRERVLSFLYLYHTTIHQVPTAETTVGTRHIRPPCLCIRFRRNIRQHMNRKTIIMEIREDLKKYIETEIIPRYDAFDRAHRRDHAFQVIARAVDMATRLGEDIETAYTAAAYHDTGLAEGRELHHEASGRIVRSDDNLRRWFSDEAVETIACAVEDHRASAPHPPRTIYGRIVAEADRAIDPETIVRRTVQYGLANHPELGREDQWERTIAHLHDKYGEGGYLHLWLKESPNAEPLKRLRRLMHDTERLRTIFEEAYNAETTACKP